MRKHVVYFLILSLAIALSALAVTDSFVQRYFRDLKSLRADFVQRVFDANARLIETSSGQMVMEKPGRFRWDYKKPFEQIIVADGERLWHYDSELEQVTVRRLDTALGSTPLALLSGAAPLDDAFVVTSSKTEDGLRWYELRPKQAQAEFTSLRVAFQGDQLNAIELQDAFSQRTRLSFNDLERNVSIDPALLRFVPPSGVDVVGDLP